MAAALIGAGSLLLLPFAGPPAFGLAYAGLPAVALIWLRALPWGLEIIVWVLAVVIAPDVFAYIAGRSIGGRKLTHALSPAKTVAGLFGWVAEAVVVGWLTATYFALHVVVGLRGGRIAV